MKLSSLWALGIIVNTSRNNEICHATKTNRWLNPYLKAFIKYTKYNLFLFFAQTPHLWIRCNQYTKKHTPAILINFLPVILALAVSRLPPGGRRTRFLSIATTRPFISIRNDCVFSPFHLPRPCTPALVGLGCCHDASAAPSGDTFNVKAIGVECIDAILSPVALLLDFSVDDVV